jgi:hypothetical protein
METLATLAASNGLRTTPLSALFDDVEAEHSKTLIEQVAEDWGTHHRIETNKIVYQWRDARNMYDLRLPGHGWFVEVEHADSLAAINKNLPTAAGTRGLLTRGHLIGEDRSITTDVAAWVRAQTLDDGSLPHGIVYPSKHGSGIEWKCYAIWLRKLDDGHPVDAEPTKSTKGCCIELPHIDPDLAHVRDRLDLIIM